MTFKLNSLKVFSLYLLFFVVIILIYIYKIHHIWEYEGFVLDFNVYKCLFSVGVLLIISFILPTDFKKPSDILLHIQFIFPIFFMLVIYSTENFSTCYMLLSIFSFLIIVLMQKIKNPIPFIRILNLNPRFIFSILTLIFIFLLLLLAITHKSYFNLNLAKVYKYRLELRNVDTGIKAYLYFSIIPISISFILTDALIRKNFLHITIVILSGILMFGFSSHKRFLFLPFAIIGFYWLVNRKKPILSLLIFLIAFTILSLLLDKYILNRWATSLFIRRVCLVPAQLNFYYYDFFSKHPKVFFTDSKWLLLDKIIGYPYDLPMAMVIGREYFNNPACDANTGWLGSGYAHAGAFGMIIYAIVLGFILKYIDFKAKTTNKYLVITSSVPFMLDLFCSTDLKTAFLSHGLLLYLLILSLIGRKKYAKKNLSHHNSSSAV